MPNRLFFSRSTKFLHPYKLAHLSLKPCIPLTEKKEVTVNWIEIIQLKSHSRPDREAAVEAFGQLLNPEYEEGLGEITLFCSLDIESDLSIRIAWHSVMPQNRKSRLGLQLAAAFARFGHIYHSAWRQCSALISEQRRKVDEHQTAV